jgi:hypothetical protein
MEKKAGKLNLMESASFWHKASIALQNPDNVV